MSTIAKYDNAATNVSGLNRDPAVEAGNRVEGSDVEVGV